MNLSPSFDVSRYARAGGYAAVAKHGGEAMAARARVGLNRRYERQVDPDGVLPAAERARRADAAMRAHMAMMTQARLAKRADATSVAKPKAKTTRKATTPGVNVMPVRRTPEGMPIDCSWCAREQGRPYLPEATDRICSRHLAEMTRQIHLFRAHIDRAGHPFSAA